MQQKYVLLYFAWMVKKKLKGPHAPCLNFFFSLFWKYYTKFDKLVISLIKNNFHYLILFHLISISFHHLFYHDKKQKAWHVHPLAKVKLDRIIFVKVVSSNLYILFTTSSTLLLYSDRVDVITTLHRLCHFIMRIHQLHYYIVIELI